jgi:hypothetical protein
MPSTGEPDRDREPCGQDDDSGEERDERPGGAGGGRVVEVGSEKNRSTTGATST